jgi:hypothetical protein
MSGGSSRGTDNGGELVLVAVAAPITAANLCQWQRQPHQRAWRGDTGGSHIDDGGDGEVIPALAAAEMMPVPTVAKMIDGGPDDKKAVDGTAR